MNDLQKFQTMLVMLAENYNRVMDENKIKTLTNLAEQAFGLNHDWQNITLKIAMNESFFPTIATIAKYLPTQKTFKLQSPKQKATKQVDRFLSFLNKALSYEDFNKGELSYLQNKFNVDRFSFARGDVNLDFRRKEWIDMLKADFEDESTPQTLNKSIESAPVLELINNVTKEIPGKNF